MIKAKDLSYTYPGASQPVLKGLNFDIAEGEIFGFLGPSGSGKKHYPEDIIQDPAQLSGRNFYSG